jgi:endonuclease/exonuclease/phosphatase family metal-dependent hydrolase
MAPREPLRIMTFNVRQMDGDDGAQSWQYRKEALAETIRQCRPALIGTQEIFPEQSAFLLDRIPQLDCFGRGRFGDNRDKHNKIFFDRSRFSVLESGDVWFSRTPSVPGSSDWDIPRPRMLTWGRLQEASRGEVLILNTHLPYGRTADQARRESARLVAAQLAALPAHLPRFLTGDFNVAPDGEIYSLLTRDWSDAWMTAQRRGGPDGTVHGFGRIAGRRIDWILHRNAGRTLAAETITHTLNGLYPSDHYPVLATFDLEPSLQ